MVVIAFLPNENPPGNPGRTVEASVRVQPDKIHPFAPVHFIEMASNKNLAIVENDNFGNQPGAISVKPCPGYLEPIPYVERSVDTAVGVQ